MDVSSATIAIAPPGRSLARTGWRLADRLAWSLGDARRSPRSPSATTGSAGTTSPTRNTATCCCRSTPRASTTPARCPSSISISTAAASTWRRRCSPRCCRSICSRPGGCSAPRSALPASPSPGGSAAASAARLPDLLALVLLATCPLYYGHMFINPKDAPFAVAMALFLLGLVRLLDQYPKPCPTTLFIVGLGFGLSIGSRILAGFGVLEAIGALALLFAIEARADGIRAAGRRAWPSPARSDPERHPRLCGDGADLALGRGQSAQSGLCHRNLLALLREALAGAVRRHADRAAGHAAQLRADVARLQAAGDSPASGRRGRCSARCSRRSARRRRRGCAPSFSPSRSPPFCRSP